MSRPKLTELVLQRLEYYEDGTVFGMSDFADITDSKTLHMILKRLTEEGKVAKVLRGVYMKPRYSKLLGENIPPRIADIAEALAQSYGWNIIPTGATALNMLGLSTQVPANYEFLSDGPYKTYEYDGTAIVFKHTNKNTELTQVSKKSALIIQALKAIGKEEIDNRVIRKIADSLSKEEKETMLQETKHCTSWVYEKIKMICEEASLGFIDMSEEQEKHGIRYIPMSFRIKKYPDRDTAEKILLEAEACNPGPWGNHSRTAAHCAEKIAEYSGMDSEKAYVLGLLHDIGRKFGKRHLGHVSDGYSYMMSLGYDDVARICLTHSFNEKDIEGYVGNRDTTPEETELIKTKLVEIELDDYDKLIQLCDAISGAEGVMDIIDRMTDVKNRYGNYDQSKWDTNLRLKAYFEERMGKDLYEAVDKEHFRP